MLECSALWGAVPTCPSLPVPWLLAAWATCQDSEALADCLYSPCLAITWGGHRCSQPRQVPRLRADLTPCSLMWGLYQRRVVPGQLPGSERGTRVPHPPAHTSSLSNATGPFPHVSQVISFL